MMNANEWTRLTHWDEADFRPIMKEIDALFRRKEWMR
jgi:hypothetical protein